jgi:hypothetical protein
LREDEKGEAQKSKGQNVHLYRARGAQVRLENILQTLTGTDVDLESFAPPL